MIRTWRVIALSSVVAAVSYWFAPPDIIAQVSGELVNFFGFLIAAVLPAMALTATALRGSGMTVKRLLGLKAALELQMDFWAGLVIMSFAAVALVVLTKSFVACAPGIDCNAIVFYQYGWFSINTRLINFLLGYMFGVVFFQLSNVLTGLRALLSVNAEAAVGEAQQRFDESMHGTASEIRQIRNPPGFGETVDLPPPTDD